MSRKGGSHEEAAIRQLTIRGLDEELGRRVRELARREGISLNRAVLELLRRGAGLSDPGSPQEVVGDSLDRIIGCWSPEEAEAFDATVADFEGIDEALWR